MANITAAAIKELREKTNVGMMECKKALTEADGDMEKAIVILRERGMAVAAKKAGRIAAEGLVWPMIAEDGTAVIVEVNCETDFAAKSDNFGNFVKDLAKIVAEKNPADVDALMELEYAAGTTVAAELLAKVQTIGENIKIRRFFRFAPEAGVVSIMYNHHLAGKIGVLVRLAVSEGLETNETVLTFGKNVCMNVAAYNPEYLDRDAVPAERLEAEKEILKAQVVNEGKPEKIAEKIVAGRLGKFYEQVCCVDQGYILDMSKSVNQVCAETAKEVGGSIKVVGFLRVECGEGLEKKVDDFAEEVARMSGK
ncbi:MAG: elongation factor Ts [Clostridia bacterium]|nr:elongation factor Ts [Clostridia bacterium]